MLVCPPSEDGRHGGEGSPPKRGPATLFCGRLEKARHGARCPSRHAQIRQHPPSHQHPAGPDLAAGCTSCRRRLRCLLPHLQTPYFAAIKILLGARCPVREALDNFQAPPGLPDQCTSTGGAAPVMRSTHAACSSCISAVAPISMSTVAAGTPSASNLARAFARSWASQARGLSSRFIVHPFLASLRESKRGHRRGGWWSPCCNARGCRRA